MAEKDMLVSIVIPVYNVRPYLTQALDSVLHQSYKSLEIIIIDDGSTDGSSEICDAYAAKDARVIVVHQTNKGLSAARNAGLDLITADVVAFLDPDDALHESFVEELLSAMIREKADLAICRYTSHRTDGLLDAEGNRKTMPSIASGTYDRIETLRALADNRINVHVWNKLYRRELWKEIRFPDGHVYEDIDTSYRIFDLCETVCVLDQTLYLNRERPRSITTTQTTENLSDKALALKHFAEYVEANTPAVFTKEQVIKRRQMRLNTMIKAFLHVSGNTAEAKKNKQRSMRKQIIEAGEESGVTDFELRTRAAWAMLRFCPGLLIIAYSFYHPAHQQIKRLGRR